MPKLIDSCLWISCLPTFCSEEISAVSHFFFLLTESILVLELLCFLSLGPGCSSHYGSKFATF
jgi:hypothetical protein